MSIVDKLLADAGLKPKLAQTSLSTRILRIGPDEAKALLVANKDNRKLRPGRVAFYSRTMTEQGWRLTHQGIAFGTDGTGIDLQHRLHAVIESGATIEIMVTEGLSKSAFEAIDQHERRSVADALRLDRPLTECARFFIECRGGKGSGATILEIGEVCGVIQDKHLKLIEACNSRRALVTSVAVRCAAILLMDMRPTKTQQIINNYRILALGHSEEWEPALHAFNRQCIQGAVTANNYKGRSDLMTRAFIALDPTRSASTKIQVSEEAIRACRQRAIRLIGDDEQETGQDDKPAKSASLRRVHSSAPSA